MIKGMPFYQLMQSLKGEVRPPLLMDILLHEYKRDDVSGEEMRSFFVARYNRRVRYALHKTQRK